MGSPSFDFRLAFSDQEKEEVKMQIYEYKTVLAGDGRNVLVREREQTYERAERIMRDVFQLHECAEEYVWLICLAMRGILHHSGAQPPRLGFLSIVGGREEIKEKGTGMGSG